jgi:hypothetical protein
MSYADGWAALHLEMPDRVPHTEYSVERHWEVVQRVTGLAVGPQSPASSQAQASLALIKAWNFDLRWSTLVHLQPFGDHRTDMGHAEYAAGGVDRRPVGPAPFRTPEQVLSLDFRETYGTISQGDWTRAFEDHYRRNCQETPDLVNMTGIYVTLISGLLEVFGWDMLLFAAGSDLARFGELTNRYATWVMQYFEALAASDVPVVMVHDDMVWSSGPFISPKWYRTYVFPNYRRLIAPLLEAGKRVIFTSDGNYTQFIDDIAQCGVHGFVLEPTTDMATIAERYGRTHAFIGNADTRILLSGPQSAIRAEVERCMAIGKSCPGFFLAVGNHIPSNTPVENVLYYQQVYEELSRR